MHNSAMNSHDAMDRLSYVMFVAAHYSVTCTDNPWGLDAQCGIVSWTIKTQKQRLWFVICATTHCSLTCIDNCINVHLNNLCRLDAWCRAVPWTVMIPTKRLSSIMCATAHCSLTRTDNCVNAEQCDQQSWCNRQTVICNVRSCTLFTHMHRELH